jgi:hypothetical protein
MSDNLFLKASTYNLMAFDPFNWTETIRSKPGTIFHSLLVQFIAKPVPSKGGLLSFHSKV